MTRAGRAITSFTSRWRRTDGSRWTHAARFGRAATETLRPLLIPVGSKGELPDAGELLSIDGPAIFVSTLKRNV